MDNYTTHSCTCTECMRGVHPSLGVGSLNILSLPTTRSHHTQMCEGVHPVSVVGSLSCLRLSLHCNNYLLSNLTIDAYQAQTL